jgi:L-serine dehydratase
MAAAAAVEAVGGDAAMAMQAASIALQHTLGLVCDPVAGFVEVPCHARNAQAAAAALVAADLALARFPNPIPLDDSVAAMLDIASRMPPEHRCTSAGGLATTPRAQAIAGRLRDAPISGSGRAVDQDR